MSGAYTRGAPGGSQYLVWLDSRGETRAPHKVDALGHCPLRFGVGGLLLLPYLLRKGVALERLGWLGLIALAVGRFGQGANDCRKSKFVLAFSVVPFLGVAPGAWQRE